MLEVKRVGQCPSDVPDSAMDPALECLKAIIEYERLEARLMDHLGSLLATREDMPQAQWRPSPYHENEQQIYPALSRAADAIQDALQQLRFVKTSLHEYLVQRLQEQNATMPGISATLVRSEQEHRP